jgi:hypothetical protein
VKTVYPKHSNSWTGDDWMPDTVLALIQPGMMQGKSVGFIRLKSHGPSSHAVAADPAMAKVSRFNGDGRRIWPCLATRTPAWAPAVRRPCTAGCSKRG